MFVASADPTFQAGDDFDIKKLMKMLLETMVQGIFLCPEVATFWCTFFLSGTDRPSSTS
jgi:hypothetical protein